jgi:hypothetical protein
MNPEIAEQRSRRCQPSYFFRCGRTQSTRSFALSILPQTKENSRDTQSKIVLRFLQRRQKIRVYN